MSENNSVRFVLDGEVVELRDVDPTRTVLQYLREDLNRTGTKEGCAEGDCGACTVVVAELNQDGNDIVVKAINSCIQFLPTLDGKELITVECLGNGDSLHPVQQAMVDEHGSQCGFCTPGFVMSLFAVYKSAARPSRRDIDDALAGNLCRCTGYRPIIAAAQAMYSGASGDDWLTQPYGTGPADKERVATLRKLSRKASLRVAFGDRSFIAPRSTDELASALADNPEATILAGGTDVGLWVTKQHRELGTVIYTGEVSELTQQHVSDTHIEIGAAVSITDAMSLITEHYPHLDELFRRFASPPIRNAGTLGGNIANGSPIGDSMPALMVAGASVVLRSTKGSRDVALDDFYHDYMVNEMQAGEFIETIRIPLPGDAELRSYKVSKRFDQDISAVCTAYRLELVDGTVASIRVACGGLAATIMRAPHCEAALIGKPWNASSVTAAQAALKNDFAPISDMRATADYRLKVCQNLLQRFFLETNGELTDTVYLYGRQG